MRFQLQFCLGLALSLSLSFLVPLGGFVLAQTPAQAPAPTQTQRASFRDVPADYWAKDYIEGLAQFNVISGFPDGTFKPNEPVTRAQFAAILRQAFMSAQPFQVPNGRFNATQLAPTFADVPNNHWASNNIATARRAGFLSGYPGNQFKPNQPLPRIQALVSIANGLGYQGGAIAGLSAYKDAASIPEYARPGIAAARAANIVVNYPALDQLMPNRPATRAEVAAFVYQALVKDGRAQPIAAAGSYWQKEPIVTIPTEAREFSLSADGQRLLVLTLHEEKIQIWDTKTGALIREIIADDQTRFPPRFHTAAISKDGTKIVVLTKSGSTDSVELSVWATETGQPLWKKTISPGPLRFDTKIAFSPDSQQIITLINISRGPRDYRAIAPQLILWNTASGEAMQSLPLGIEVSLLVELGVHDFSLSPNGQFLAVMSHETATANLVSLWQRNQSGIFEYARTLPSEENIFYWGLKMAFTNDGLLNVLTRSTDEARLVAWKPQTGERIKSTVVPPERADNFYSVIDMSSDGDIYHSRGQIVGAYLISTKTGEIREWNIGYRGVFSDRGDYLAIMNNNPDNAGSGMPAPSISIYSKTAP